MYSDIQVEDKKHENKAQKGKETWHSCGNNEKDVENIDKKGKSNALKAFAESHFGESKIKKTRSGPWMLPNVNTETPNIANAIESETRKENVNYADTLENEQTIAIETPQAQIPTNEENKRKESVFKVQLKKVEIIKRPITKPKLETIKLKHHNFEIQPQQPANEQCARIKLTEPINQRLQGDNQKVHKDKKKIRKGQRKTNRIKQSSEPVTDIKDISFPDSKLITESEYSSNESEVNGNKDISNGNEIGENYVDEPPDFIENHTYLPVDTNSKQSILPAFPRIASKQRKRTPMVMPTPKTKPIAQNNKIEVILESDQSSSESDTTKPFQKLKYLEEDCSSSKVENVALEEEREKKVEDEREETPIFSRKRLKKVEVNKSEIEKTKIEQVELYHHEFESVPQEVPMEMGGIIALSFPLFIYEEEEIHDTTESELEDIEHAMIPKNEMEQTKKNLGLSDSKIDKSRKSSSQNVTEGKDTAFKTGKASKSQTKVFQKVEEHQPSLLKLKLKKSETQKLKLEKTQLQSVPLKHHEFERSPQLDEKEEVSNIKLGKPLHIDYEEKSKKAPKNRNTEEMSNDKNRKAQEKTFPPNCANDSLTQPLPKMKVDPRCVCSFCFFNCNFYHYLKMVNVRCVYHL